MSGQQISRVTPRIGPENMKTYKIVAPQGPTHWRKASCEEVECPNQANGWQTLVDESTELGQRQAWYIRNQAKRKYTEERRAGGTTVFTFAADQQCFAEHTVRTGAPELYLVRGGDWRGDPRGGQARRHTRPADWVDDFATHQQKLADRIEKG